MYLNIHRIFGKPALSASRGFERGSAREGGGWRTRTASKIFTIDFPIMIAGRVDMCMIDFPIRKAGVIIWA